MIPDKEIFYTMQAIAAIFLRFNVKTVPVDNKFMDIEKYCNIKSIKNLLTNLQIMLYNWEQINNKPHPYNKILTDFYFKFYKLKKAI